MISFIATTNNSKDDQIINFANIHNFKFFRGSEDDVMSRVIGAAEYMNAELWLRSQEIVH